VIRYAIRRLVAAAIVIVIVMAFLAILDRLIPGNPVTFIFGPRANPFLIHQVRQEMGLNVSVPVQIYQYIFNALHGNLGVDFVTDRSVSSLVMENLPYTVVLAVSGLGLAVVVGVPLGIIAATRPGGILDRVIGIVSVSVITVPSFVVGLILILIFAVHLGLFPVIGAGAPGQPLDDLHHLILPAIALAVGWIGYLARLVRSNMLEVLTANYVRTAYAFGIRRRRVFYKYALKNAGPRNARLQRHLLAEPPDRPGDLARDRRHGHRRQPARRLLVSAARQSHPAGPDGPELRGAIA